MDLSHAISQPKPRKNSKSSHLNSILPKKIYSFNSQTQSGNQENNHRLKDLKENMTSQNFSDQKNQGENSNYNQDKVSASSFKQKSNFFDNPLLTPNNQESSANSDINLNSKIEELEIRVKVLKQDVEHWKNEAAKTIRNMKELETHQEHLLSGITKSTKKQTVMLVLNFINTINLSLGYTPKSQDEEVQKFVETLKSNFVHALEQLKSKQIEILIPEIGDLFDPSIMSILNPEVTQNQDKAVVVERVVTVGLKIENQLVQPVSIMI